uniref:Telomere repeat-binding protein 6 n=8 Tax=Noccaea caerulescens TaxID=107243 RepID=A0A1J3JB67_NOCCA
MGPLLDSVEDYGEMFQNSIAQTNETGNPVVYKLVRVAQDGRLVPATDEEMLEVKDLLENNENDMPSVPDPGQTEENIPDEWSPSQFLQLEGLEGLFQSETEEAYTENLNSGLESKEELLHGSQMLSTLPDTKYQSSNELPGNEELVQSEVLLQEPIRFSSNGCSMDQSMDVSTYSSASGSPKAPALSTAASKPEFSRETGERCLKNHSIQALQETFRATFGRETTCKDKQWLKRRITMGWINPCVVDDNKHTGGGNNNYNDTIDAFSKDTVVDEGRANNCKDTPSSPDCTRGRSNDFRHSPVEAFVDHYSGNEDFEGEYRSAKRARKPTRRYIEETSKMDEKQQSNESPILSKDKKSISVVSSGGRVVSTRMVSLSGSRIQVPYVSHVRRSRPRENIMALGDFHSSSWEVKAAPEESNLNRSHSQLNNDVNRVSGVKSVSGPVKQELANLSDEDQDMVEPEDIGSSGDSSDDNNNHNNRVDLPIIKRKHHRAWTLSEVTTLVEGVSTYGVGKWSVIKRVSCSLYAHRSTVDLKDKWRNLLKASFAQTSSNRLKHGPIPSQVLLKVRELAQKQSKASKARLVKGSRNGFL